VSYFNYYFWFEGIQIRQFLGEVGVRRTVKLVQSILFSPVNKDVLHLWKFKNRYVIRKPIKSWAQHSSACKMYPFLII
jgi:hypothetical protein